MTSMPDEVVTAEITARSPDRVTTCVASLFNSENSTEVLPAPIPVGSKQHVIFTDIPDGLYSLMIRVAPDQSGTISGFGALSVPGP
jgi:hypothetical protein